MNLLENLRYDPAAGHFVWTEKRGPRAAGSIAGGVSGNGYWQVRIGGRLYYAHRLAWLAVHGEFPNGELDHINGDPLDNRIENLRVATRAQNQRNTRGHIDSASRLKGAYYDKRKRRWYSCLRVDGRNRFLGYHQSPSEAHAAHAAASLREFGSFARIEKE